MMVRDGDVTQRGVWGAGSASTRILNAPSYAPARKAQSPAVAWGSTDFDASSAVSGSWKDVGGDNSSPGS